jgi:hypothetical protein
VRGPVELPALQGEAVGYQEVERVGDFAQALPGAWIALARDRDGGQRQASASLVYECVQYDGSQRIELPGPAGGILL